LKKIYKPAETVVPFYQRYINLVPDDGNLLIHLEDIFSETEEMIGPLTEEEMIYRYAEGKWTIKDILVHLADAERIFIYRALRFARADETPLAAFKEEDYAKFARANERTRKISCVNFHLLGNPALLLLKVCRTKH